MSLFRCVLCVFFSISPTQQVALYAAPGGVIIKSIAEFLALKTGKEVTDQSLKKMTHEVGEQVIERTASRLVREGGEGSLARAASLTAIHGPEIVRALDNAPDALPILRLLDELPNREVAAAATRLSAGNAGKELATISCRLGSRVLRAEATHPGVGYAFAKALGNDGVELSLKLTSEQAIGIGRHVDDIAKLPLPQQSQIIALVDEHPGQFAHFVGRFIERNPGKILFTSAATSLILAQPARFLGGDEIVFDSKGNPVVVSKPGIIGRTGKIAENIVSAPLQRMLYLLGMVVVGAFSLYLGMRICSQLLCTRWFKR